MEVDGLDDFSRSFADVLFAAFPDLREHASAEDGALRIHLSPGPSRPDSEFWIDTFDEEVTVAFGHFHMHFDWPVRRDGAWCDPIDVIRSIRSDDALVEDWQLDGEWMGSSLRDAGEEPDTADMKPGHVLYVRSWSGARDRTIRGSASAPWG